LARLTRWRARRRGWVQASAADGGDGQGPA
jgi:hypothetical protein